MSDEHQPDLSDAERRAFAALSREAPPPPGLESRIVRRVIDDGGYGRSHGGWTRRMTLIWRPGLVLGALAVAFLAGTEVGRQRAEAGRDAVPIDVPTLSESLASLEGDNRLRAALSSGPASTPAEAGPTGVGGRGGQLAGPISPMGPDDHSLYARGPSKTAGETRLHPHRHVGSTVHAEIALMVARGWLADDPFSRSTDATVASVVKELPPGP